jgi:gliding motility-associated-like protein
MRKILRGRVFIKTILFTLCLGLSFLGAAHAQVSGTFTINSGAATGGSNFQSFSAAVAHLAGGVNGPVTFNVQAGSGPYNEQVIINAISGTSAANTVTFNCNGVTLTFLSFDYYQRAGVKLNGADYITFDNLNVTPEADDFGEYGYGFHLLNDADNNTIRNCHISNFVDWNNTSDHEGIVINGSDGATWEEGDSHCDNNLIQNNTITGGSIGITIVSVPPFGNPPAVISGNRIIGNTISNSVVFGIQMQGTSGTVIDGNNISGGPDATESLIGIYVNYINYSFSIVNNKIHGFHLNGGNDAYGMYIASESASGQTCLLANNLFYDFTTSGTVYGIFSSSNGITPFGASYLNIYNNTISLDDQSVPGIGAYGLYFDATTDVSFMNNIVTVTRNSSSNNYGIYFMSDPQNYVSQRNVIYVPDGPAAVDAIGSYRFNDYFTMNAWKAATRFDYYSTDVNPAYSGLASFNFKPTTQAIDNLAANLNILTDIDGTARNTTNPDVGCYEFISIACSQTITSGSVTVSPDSILCSGPQITLGLTGYTAGGGQTYTWQVSTTPTGTYTDIASPLGFPYLEITPTGTKYYRVALACGATTVFSSPKRVMVNTMLNAGTYTINSAQPTGGVNFSSFTDASRALQCGFNGSLVFNVASGSGPYNEQLLLVDIPTSDSRKITFNCNGVTLSYAPGSLDSGAVVKLSNTDYITIDSLNIEVQGSTTFGFGVQLLNDADHNIIRRCKVNLSKTTKNNLYSGILITSLNTDPMGYGFDSYCDSNLITSNTITGGYYGISLASNSNNVSQSSCIGNIVSNNTIHDSYGYGIFMSGLGFALIDSNDISQPTRTILPGEFYGIYMYNYNYGVTISRNRIHNLGENVKTNATEFQGIKCERVNWPQIAPESNFITNNLLYTFRGRGLQYGFNNVSSRNIKYYHNTVSLDDSSYANSSESIGFGTFGAAAEQVEVKNNIFYIHRSGNGDQYGIYVNNLDHQLVADYNDYFISATGTNVRTGYLNGNSYNALADWQAGSGKDAGSVAIHPVFMDMEAGDYTPTKIAFENKGFNIGIASDLNNVIRNTTTPDIGAIEFTICRQLATPALTVEEASVNTVKYTWTAVSGTSGYRVSRDGINWTIPSSGALGTSHTVVGLNPTDKINLIVKALGSRVDCPEYASQMVEAQAQTDQVFIPNMFSPNNNGTDDYFKVYTTVMKSMHLMVFNQWGVKIFETSDPAGTWDGTYKGKPQPVGVYVYVVTGALFDGSKVNKKGTFNLIR